MDKLSVQRIEQLHPANRQSALDVLAEIEKALTGQAKVRFTFTLRSIVEQDALYALGRTKVNPDGKSAQRPFGYKVTNAKGGQSIHNFGMAIDIALILDGKEASWNDVKDFDGDGISDWMECVAIFKNHGWSWGGDWSSFVDKPHFQYTHGLTLSQLQAKRNAKDFITGTTYVNVGKSSPKQFKTIIGLNLRSSPSTSNQPIMVIPSGSIVIEIKRAGEWSEISFGPKIGFVSNKYLK